MTYYLFPPFSDIGRKTLYHFHWQKRHISPLSFSKTESEVKVSKVFPFFPIFKKFGEWHIYRADEIKIAIVSMNLLFLHSIFWHKIWKGLILWIKDILTVFFFFQLSLMIIGEEALGRILKTSKHLARSLKIRVRITCMTRLTGYLTGLIIQFNQNP